MDDVLGEIITAPVDTPEVPIEHEIEHAAETVQHEETHETHKAEHAEQQETLEHIAQQVTETRALEEAEWRTNLLTQFSQSQSRLEGLEAKIDSLLSSTHSQPESNRNSQNGADGPREVEIEVQPLESEPSQNRRSRRMPYRNRKR